MKTENKSIGFMIYLFKSKEKTNGLQSQERSAMIQYLQFIQCLYAIKGIVFYNVNDVNGYISEMKINAGNYADVYKRPNLDIRLSHFWCRDQDMNLVKTLITTRMPFLAGLFCLSN